LWSKVFKFHPKSAERSPKILPKGCPKHLKVALWASRQLLCHVCCPESPGFLKRVPKGAKREAKATLRSAPNHRQPHKNHQKDTLKSTPAEVDEGMPIWESINLKIYVLAAEGVPSSTSPLTPQIAEKVSQMPP